MATSRWLPASRVTCVRLNEQVFNRHTGQNPVERIYGLMRTVLLVQDALGPLLVPLDSLANRSYTVVAEELRQYFRDVHDHLAAVTQRVGTLHDLLNNILAANLTRVSIRQNEDMRKISAWVAIAAVPTMVAGIYGMNFDHMPELRSPWGYPTVLLITFGVCFWLYRKFKTIGLAVEPHSSARRPEDQRESWSLILCEAW